MLCIARSARQKQSTLFECTLYACHTLWAQHVWVWFVMLAFGITLTLILTLAITLNINQTLGLTLDRSIDRSMNQSIIWCQFQCRMLNAGDYRCRSTGLLCCRHRHIEYVAAEVPKLAENAAKWQRRPASVRVICSWPSVTTMSWTSCCPESPSIKLGWALPTLHFMHPPSAQLSRGIF